MTMDRTTPHPAPSRPVALTVEEDGNTKQATASGDPSPSLRICLEEAVKRTKFTRGPEIIDLMVTVEWSPEGWNRAAKITGRHVVPKVDI